MSIYLVIGFVILIYILIPSFRKNCDDFINNIFPKKDIIHRIDDLEEKMLNKFKDLEKYQNKKD